MPALITELIDKQDTFELVRNEIAAILLVETANQVALASAASRDPREWALRVFVEHNDPIVDFQDAPEDPLDATPCVNVTYERDDRDGAASDVIERQTHNGNYHIDCYGYGIARADASGGHQLADRMATLASQRAGRLVRNILMHPGYRCLGLNEAPSRLVLGRDVASRQEYQPEFDGRASINVMCLRIALTVRFNEYAPQFSGQSIDTVFATVKRAETGEVYLTAQHGDPNDS